MSEARQQLEELTRTCCGISICAAKKRYRYVGTNALSASGPPMSLMLGPAVAEAAMDDCVGRLGPAGPAC